MYVMNSSPSSPDPKQPPQQTVILLLTDIADTTWRMFVPTLSLGGLGYWGDTTWHTAPWLAVGGVIVGAGIAAILVKQQLHEVEK